MEENKELTEEQFIAELEALVNRFRESKNYEKGKNTFTYATASAEAIVVTYKTEPRLLELFFQNIFEFMSQAADAFQVMSALETIFQDAANSLVPNEEDTNIVH